MNKFLYGCERQLRIDNCIINWYHFPESCIVFGDTMNVSKYFFNTSMGLTFNKKALNEYMPRKTFIDSHNSICIDSGGIISEILLKYSNLSSYRNYEIITEDEHIKVIDGVRSIGSPYEVLQSNYFKQFPQTIPEIYNGLTINK